MVGNDKEKESRPSLDGRSEKGVLGRQISMNYYTPKHDLVDLDVENFSFKDYCGKFVDGL